MVLLECKLVYSRQLVFIKKKNCFLFYLIAALPREILMYIFRWVVSSDLDMRALEQLSLVCRGFYICARSAPLS